LLTAPISYLVWRLTISSEGQLSKYIEADDTPVQDHIHRAQHLQAKINTISTSRLNLDVESTILLTDVAQFLLLPGYTLLVFTLDGVPGIILKILVLSLVSYLLTSMFSRGSQFWVTVTLISHLSLLHIRLLGKFQQWFNRILARSRVHDEERLNGQLLLATANQPPDQWTIQDRHTSAADSIIWTIGKLVDVEVIAGFVLEVVWHDHIKTTPMMALYHTLLGCFDRWSGHLVLIPAHRDKAYICAKALLHVAVQRKCLGIHSDEVVFQDISGSHLIMGYQLEGDPELASVLVLIDIIFQPDNAQPGDAQPGPWDTFTFTTAHHAWTGHILLYRAWSAHRKQTPFPSDVMGFVDSSLRLKDLPLAPIVADCIIMICLFLGIDIDLEDLSAIDKR